ncbi:MAG TPA: hypothetical protein VKR55_13930, partial [Bradyrhizobium sp.]|uniref:hypothetical protein n=1 Tax=Bradyrhizobium sp. TaxID=376 RepID=UPI002CDDDCB9
MDARDPVACRANHFASLRFIRSKVKRSAQKYSASVFRNIMICFAHPAPARGAFRPIVTNVERDAMDVLQPVRRNWVRCG